MFELEDKILDLKFDIRSISQIERMTGGGVMAAMVNNSAMFTINEMQTYLGVGLIDDAGKRFNFKQAQNIGMDLIQQEGYVTMCSAIIDALERDCPFLFQGA